ncbi:hypothetical protein C8R42DRAFT_235882 [Lentinula raphanica]|nr:hypothetical protein C8R42DRAFT_235882 [Lentinula raphanica]
MINGWALSLMCTLTPATLLLPVLHPASYPRHSTPSGYCMPQYFIDSTGNGSRSRLGLVTPVTVEQEGKGRDLCALAPSLSQHKLVFKFEPEACSYSSPRLEIFETPTTNRLLARQLLCVIDLQFGEAYLIFFLFPRKPKERTPMQGNDEDTKIILAYHPSMGTGSPNDSHSLTGYTSRAQ